MSSHEQLFIDPLPETKNLKSAAGMDKNIETREQCLTASSRPEWARLVPISMSLVICSLQLIVFSVSAARGFDLTDEGFYILSYGNWSNLPGFSLFGAYFQWPYEAMERSVQGIRILGFVVLLTSGFYFTRQLILSIDLLEGRANRSHIHFISIAGGAAIWSYYGAFPGPYTPSYNLLALTSALASCALALRASRDLRSGAASTSHWIFFFLGLVTSVGIANKFSTGILILLVDLGVLLLLRPWKLSRGTSISLLFSAVSGFSINFLLLLLIKPDLVSGIKIGVLIQWANMPRDLLSEVASTALIDLPKAIGQSLRILMWPVLFVVVIRVIGRLFVDSDSQLTNGFLVLGLIVSSTYIIYFRDNRLNRLVLIYILLLTIIAAIEYSRGRFWRPEAKCRSLLMYLFVSAIPACYSAGTNNSVLMHMGMAAVFPIALILVELRLLWISKIIPIWTLILSVICLMIAPTEIIVRQWMDGNYTYRLPANLSDSNSLVAENHGGIRLMVPSSQAISLNHFINLMKNGGFSRGERVVDFTGQAPGLVAVIGGVPLGTAWIVGGYSFDGNAAARVALSYVPENDLRCAWLITTADGTARISGWEDIVERIVGIDNFEIVGSAPIGNSDAGYRESFMNVTVWRPNPQALKKCKSPVL